MQGILGELKIKQKQPTKLGGRRASLFVYGTFYGSSTRRVSFIV